MLAPLPSRCSLLCLAALCLLPLSCGNQAPKPIQQAAGGELSEVDDTDVDVHEWGPKEDWTPWQKEAERLHRMDVSIDEILISLKQTRGMRSVKWVQNERGYINAFASSQTDISLAIRQNRKEETVEVSVDTWIDHTDLQSPIPKENQRFAKLREPYIALVKLAKPDADVAELTDWLTTTKHRRGSVHSLIRDRHRFEMSIPNIGASAEGFQMTLMIRSWPD